MMRPPLPDPPTAREQSEVPPDRLSQAEVDYLRGEIIRLMVARQMSALTAALFGAALDFTKEDAP